MAGGVVNNIKNRNANKMSHKEETLLFSSITAIIGVVKLYFIPMTGLSVYISKLLDISGFPIQLFEAGITAFLCGFLGAGGKHVLTWGVKKFKIKKRK